MAKIVIFVVCALVLYALMRNKILPNKKEPAKELDTTNMEKDPICATFVSVTDTPYRVKYYDMVFYFCSEECMNKFKEQKTAEAKKAE